MIHFISSFYYFLRILSLDVALGGVVLSASIARFYGQSLSIGVYLSLFFSIWLIYTFDHWLDARKSNGIPSMKRHQFHYNYRIGILISMVLVFILAMSSLVLVPVITLIYGLMVFLVVVIYFILSWKMKVFMIKEVLIASVYATGVLLGPVSLIDVPLAHFICLLLQIFGLALINLLVLSYYEFEHDTKDRQHSWAIKHGLSLTQKHIKRIIMVLLVGQMFSFYWMADQLFLQSILIGMSLTLWLIFRMPRWFKEEERYRSFSDLVFFLPGLIFWF